MTASHSIHRAAADLMAEKWAQDQHGAKLLSLSYLMTRDERLEANVAVMGQPYSDWSMGQLFALYCLMKIYTRGSLTITQFPIPGMPVKDRDRLQNQEILNSLPGGISANVTVDQRGAEADGFIQWSTPIQGLIEASTDDRKEEVAIAPRNVPLEIGYTDASTTCFHLIRSGGVARWPYGHNVLVILTTYPRGIVLKWRNNPPDDPILADFGEFANRMVLTRMWRGGAWGVHEPRPLEEQRLQTALDSFWPTS